jgi:transcriptional regulator with XRE-family HTH domain
MDQTSLASLIGISRPTLANILAGRFGASPRTAERLAEIIAMTPAFERQPFLPGLWIAVVPLPRYRAVFGEPTLADAILDRIIHNAHRLQLKGDSLRKQKAPKTVAA